MISAKKQHQGVTLLEVILVLVIATSIIYMSIQQYVVYKQAADVETVKYNVALLFQGMSQYFQANCKTMMQSAITPYPISMSEVNGYLSGTLQQSAIADIDGYVMQFNYTNPTVRTIDVTPVGSPATIGMTLVWQAQVSVKLTNTATAEAYENLLGANCLSSLNTNYVNPCGSGGTDYAVFNQLPSYSSSTYWPTMPVVGQFTQMYRTLPLLYLVDQPGAGNMQYFVCGSSWNRNTYP